jgi:hypothetical protein
MCFEFTLLIFIEVWVLSWEHHECTLLKFEMFPTFCLRKLDIVTLWVVMVCLALPNFHLSGIFGIITSTISDSI